MKNFRYKIGLFVGCILNSLADMFTPVHGFKGASAALVKYGEMLADIRGKINGTVHSRNKAGAYMRNLVIPTNPQTSFQQAVRAALAGFSSSWRGLTAAQRAAWEAATANFPSTNIFGDVRELTGISLFNGINLNLFNIGEASITAPPSPVGATAVTALSGAAAAGAGTFTVAFAPDPVPAGHTLVIEATAQLSPGINNFTNRLRKLQLVAAAAVSPADVHAAYVARFGALVAGQKIGLRAKLVRISTGEVSQALTASVIVAA